MAKLFTPISPETDGDIDALLSTMIGANGAIYIGEFIASTANDSNGSISNVEKYINFYCPHSLAKFVTNGEWRSLLATIQDKVH